MRLVFISIILVPIIHELGHYIVAFLFGHKLKFKFSFGKYYVPRWVWEWPDVSKTKLRAICIAGFGLEMALIPFMPGPYQAAAIAHFLAYPFYAGGNNDFAGMV